MRQEIFSKGKKLIKFLVLLIPFFEVNAQTITYQYDNLHRLKNATYPNGKAIAYSYDALGNRTSEVISVSVVPLEWLYFKAQATEANAALLVWQTANEWNTNRFDIERSVDGKTFEKIGEQKAFGNTATKQHYEFLDKNLPPQYQTFYYRLRQIDDDGTYNYSKIETIDLGSRKSLSIEVYPNPNDGHFSILLLGIPLSKSIDFQLIDVTGRLVWQQIKNVHINVLTPDLSALPNGVYMLKVRDGGQFWHLKIVVQR